MKQQTLAVQRMQDYIDAHLSEDISLTDLAGASYYSPWHSYRLFRAYLGQTPTEYIRRLRLSRSAMRLKHEGGHIIDVAFELGFGSVDGYTRAFHREFGCNPSDYARDLTPITLFIPYGVKFREPREEATDMENMQTVFVQVIQRPARRALIKRGVKAEDYMAYCGEVGCDVWGLLTSMDSLCGEPVCLWLPPKYRRPGTSTYVQGVEAPRDYSGLIPAGFDLIELPACEYLMFQGQPFREEDYATAIEAVQQAMSRYRPALIGYEWDDENPRIQLEPRGERGYIEMRAVKRSRA